MTTSSLPISRLVNVTVNLSPIPAQMQNLNDLLILGSSDVINAVERKRDYNTLAEVAADFGTTAPEYQAAVLWFEQTPQPVTLTIGRWAQTATAAKLIGSTLSAVQQALATWNAVTSGTFFVIINGVPEAITGLNFAASANLNGVAGVIQTALNSNVAGTTCVWNANYQRFEIEDGTTGATSTIGFVAAPTAVGNYSFGSTQPTTTDTVVIGGTSIAFTSGTPSGSQVKIGSSVAVTIQNLLTFLQASVDTNLVKFYYTADATHLYLYAATPGAAGDLLTITAAGATPPTASGATLAGATGTDISAMLGLTSSSSGSYIADGIAAETAAATAALFDINFGQSWYGLNICGAADADHLAVAPFIEGASNKHIYGVTTTEAAVLNVGDTTNIAYKLKQLGYNRTMTQYSSSNSAAVVSAMARILTTDYSANNTVITLMYKQEPGIVPETLNTAQVTALETANCNVFLSYNNSTAIFEPGVMASGNFVDIITGTDWLALDIQTSCYNLMYTSLTKIPQTDAGTHQFTNTIEAVCSQGVTNGLLAPGTWTSGGFGVLNTGDYLPKGFYVYAPPIALQNPADRAARKSVPFQVAAKLAGAIQYVDVAINVNR